MLVVRAGLTETGVPGRLMRPLAFARHGGSVGHRVMVLVWRVLARASSFVDSVYISVEAMPSAVLVRTIDLDRYGVITARPET